MNRGNNWELKIWILEFKGLMVLASMILQYLSGGASEQLAGKLQVWFCFGNSDFFPESPVTLT